MASIIRPTVSRMLLVSLAACLLTAPASAQDVTDSAKFSPVPGNVRNRLIERLNQFLEYDRTGQYEKKYDLLSDYHLKILKWSKSDYLRVMQENEQKGKAERLIDFKVTSVENRSLDDSGRYMIYNIYGNEKFLRGGKRKVEKRLIEARYENGEWYFSDWLVEYVNY
ncbi:MAG: hypothetical protein M3362_18765 [Acidobacteriota bacterium]|nr:hypothetical protein [Acidobacteriota bacterium]